MDTKQILTDLRIERDRIDRAIAALEGLDGTAILKATAPSAQPALAKARGRRRMSAAARRKIAEAQKARWAERNATTALIGQVAPVKSGGRRTVSAASRKKMAEAQRKRWAARKKAAKT